MKNGSSPIPVFQAPETEVSSYHAVAVDDSIQHGVRPDSEDAPKPRPISTREAWKLAIRVTDIVFTFANLLIIGALMALDDFANGAVLMVATYPMAGISLSWHLAELVTLIACRTEHGIHPGAHVGMQLLISALWITSTVLSVCTGTLFIHPSWNTDGASDVLPFVAIAFFSIIMLNNFTLFVIACRETDVLNKEKRLLKAAGAPAKDLDD